MAKKNTYRKRKPEGARPGFHAGIDWSRLKALSLDNVHVDLSFLQDKRLRISLGLGLITFAIILFLAFLSSLSSVRADQSVLQAVNAEGMVASGGQARNWLGLLGASLSHLFIYRWFGIASFLLPPLFLVLGWRISFDKELLPIGRTSRVLIFLLLWISLFFGYWLLIDQEGQSGLSFYAGGLGYSMAVGFNSFIGWGTPLILLLSMSIFLLYTFQVKSVVDKFRVIEAKFDAVIQAILDFFLGRPDAKKRFAGGKGPEANANTSTAGTPPVTGNPATGSPVSKNAPANEEEEEDGEDEGEEPDFDIEGDPNNLKGGLRRFSGNYPMHVKNTLPAPIEPAFSSNDDLEMSVEDTQQYQEASAEAAKGGVGIQLTINQQPKRDEVEEIDVEDFDEYDPTLDLPHFKQPSLDILNEIDNSHVKVTSEELQENKNRIVKTLSDFKIGISSIKATIGPTVTLYEIVPKAGMKISRIKSLEDDIALSLSALGIRIIAPMPGQGTIGIEVPNKNRQMVSIRSLLATEKFTHTTKDLPIALGKTISNEVFVTDLAKMPHLLMAGATGQGKSVGLNIVLASLLYAKHPSELKFVLIDPKKVELSIFSKIERHYLATLPDAEEPIITDTSRVVHTLNSLCVEMDVRYNLLKDAGCRNIKEYNSKFKSRRLNPDSGHRFLPYIVLVIDELADLMMVAGKEVELPIARLAQLARAIGIHLIIATQRPSVNVITGIIKANFPARLSYKVTSKIDSRTILDMSGADQLIGMGDMLLSNGSEVIRLQCAYIDTEEVNKLCEYIASQRGYDTAYLLPEYEDEEAEIKQVDLSKLDSMFAEAARMIVINQQGSTSLLQRKLSLGYNRAGRIIDQLEAAGIVGPFEGSKARQVLIQDEVSLERVLSELGAF